MKNKDPEEKIHNTPSNKQLSYPSSTEEQVYSRHKVKQEPIYLDDEEEQEIVETKPNVKLDARSLKSKQISSSAEELMRERENIESKFTNSRKISKRPETILLDDE